MTTFDGNVVVLVGGVGGAKLAHGLYQALPPEQLTVIVNTGDDFWHYGLRICPDLDTITYTLSGLVNKAFGWGVGGDTFHMLEALKRLGESPWFGLGDQDLAIHLTRTAHLQNAQTLTQITQDLRHALGIKCAILPMTDAPVETIVYSKEFGALGFQEYFVKYRWQPTLEKLVFRGAEAATISPQVRSVIESADVILVGPSNPWLSIQPILKVPGLRALIESRNVPRVAVTPLIQGQAVKGPTAKLMAELGLVVSPKTVVEFYGSLINGFILDERDRAEAAPIADENMRVITLDTLMDDESKRVSLAQNILAVTKEWKTT